MPDLLVGGGVIDDSHLRELERALYEEEGWERHEHEATLRLSLAERVAAGVTLAPLTIETVQSASRGRSRVRLRAPRGMLLHDGIGAGDAVVMAPTGTPDDGVFGTSLGDDGRVIELLVDGQVDDARAQAVTRRFDPTTFQRYRAALQRADRTSTPLREILLGRSPPGRVQPVDLPVGTLNPAQHAALCTALGSPRLALIHGPPGTGKTEVITALLRALVATGDRPWALADSNAAVDHLALRASAAGLDVLRLGAASRISPAVYDLSLDARVDRGPLGAVLRDLDREILRVDPRDRRKLYDERDRTEAHARDAILQTVQVIASTLGTLAREAPNLPNPHTAIVDEATQAIEPAVWVAVPFAERLVLVGDPHQLGPVVMQPGNPLATSLLDRAMPLVPMPMLSTQYRMNAHIQSLVAGVYPSLVAAPSVADRRIAGLPPMLWVDTAGAGLDERRDPSTRSLYNPGEVAIVARAVGELLAAGVAAKDIGVVAPYSAQVARLAASPVLRDVEVATVNAFQGREKDAIVCTFVRSNPDGELGFVADRRRLVVALTRARRYLLCTGDSATLATSPDFARVFEVFAAKDCWATVWESPWSEAVET